MLLLFWLLLVSRIIHILFEEYVVKVAEEEERDTIIEIGKTSISTERINKKGYAGLCFASERMVGSITLSLIIYKNVFP